MKHNMSKLYDDLINIINFEPDKDEETQMEKYFEKQKKIWSIWNTFIPLIVIFVVFLYFFGGVKGCCLYGILLVVIIIIYKCYQRKFWAQKDIIVNNCEFNKVLTMSVLTAGYVRDIKEQQKLIISIANMLFYLGRFDEAKRVVDLAINYCNTPMGNIYRISLYATIARCEMDKERVWYYIKEIENIMSQAHLPRNNKVYQNVIKYPLFIELEETGNYAKALELMGANEKEPMVNKVSRNYRLYRIAKTAGLDAEAVKHRDFVLEHGGDTFFRRYIDGN